MHGLSVSSVSGGTGDIVAINATLSHTPLFSEGNDTKTGLCLWGASLSEATLGEKALRTKGSQRQTWRVTADPFSYSNPRGVLTQLWKRTPFELKSLLGNIPAHVFPL